MVNRRLNITKGMPDTVQRFRVADQLIAFRFKPACERIDDTFLGGPVEIDHDVPAPDHRERRAVTMGLDKIQQLEIDRVSKCRFHSAKPLRFAVPAKEELTPTLRRDAVQTIERVSPSFGSLQNPGRYIRGQDAKVGDT